MTDLVERLRAVRLQRGPDMDQKLAAFQALAQEAATMIEVLELESARYRRAIKAMVENND